MRSDHAGKIRNYIIIVITLKVSQFRNETRVGTYLHLVTKQGQMQLPVTRP